MLKTSMLIQEESRIFNELLSRVDALSEEQMQVVGVAREWSTKDLLAHLASWEQGAAEAGTGTLCRHVVPEEEDLGRN